MRANPVAAWGTGHQARATAANHASSILSVGPRCEGGVSRGFRGQDARDTNTDRECRGRRRGTGHRLRITARRRVRAIYQQSKRRAGQPEHAGAEQRRQSRHPKACAGGICADWP